MKIKMNRTSSGGYFVYYEKEAGDGFEYGAFCRFCDDPVMSLSEETVVYVKREKGQVVSCRCCTKPECREVALLIGEWKVPPSRDAIKTQKAIEAMYGLEKNNEVQ